ncbi:MAG: GxxExxY protein [Sphingobacteriales bacterium]|jgi:GxxExxY protein
MKFTDYSKQAIGCAIEVHKELGPGLLESAYQECLFYQLRKNGLNVQKEFPVPLMYHEVHLECGYRIDLLVENSLIIEVKSVDALNDVHLAQVLTYLKLQNLKSGLLINFNVVKLTNGLRRVVNNYY